MYTASAFKDELKREAKYGPEPGAKCLIAGIDELMSFRPGEFTLIFGPSNCGKTELVGSIVAGLIRETREKAAICSLEQHPRRMFSALASKLGRKPLGTMDEAELEKYLGVAERFVLCVDSGAGRVYAEELFELLASQEIGTAVIDPLACLSGYGGSYDITKDFAERAARFVKNTGIRLLVVAHPSKTSAREGGGMYGVAGAGDLTNLADNVLALSPYHGDLRVNIAKIREQNPDRTGTCFLRLDRQTMGWETVPEQF